MTRLCGHDEAIAAFRDGMATGRLHHAWLISGPRGIGKGLFARAASLRLLAEGAGPPVELPGLEVPDDHPTAKLISAGSHPDRLLLERLETDKGIARNINVDQVRRVGDFFAIKPSMSPWRAVIVDAVDDLERSGANAFLKILEEPQPNSVIFLVSHAPENLLPTIRSRCRHVRLKPLESDVMASALREALPDASEHEISDMVAIGDGAPGQAIAFRDLDIGALDKTMRELASQGDADNGRRVKLAAALTPKAAQPRYEVFLQRVPSFIAAEARGREGRALAEALRLWERASDLAGSAPRLSLDPHSVTFELAGLLAALAPVSAPEISNV